MNFKQFINAIEYCKVNLGITSLPRFKENITYPEYKGYYSCLDNTIYYGKDFNEYTLVHELVHYKQYIIDKNINMWTNYQCLFKDTFSYLMACNRGKFLIEKEAIDFTNKYKTYMSEGISYSDHWTLQDEKELESKPHKHHFVETVVFGNPGTILQCSCGQIKEITPFSRDFELRDNT